MGSLRYHDGDGHKNVALKVNFHSFSLISRLLQPFILSNVSEVFFSQITKNHIQVQERGCS